MFGGLVRADSPGHCLASRQSPLCTALSITGPDPSPFVDLVAAVTPRSLGGENAVEDGQRWRIVTNALVLLWLLAISDQAKDAEILAVRHQIAFLERQLHRRQPR